MKTLEEQRVVSMVRAGTITPEEGNRIIRALEPRPARWKMLCNPFDQLSTQALWILAVVVTGVGLAVARLGIRFDGTLDLHPIPVPVPWNLVVIDVVCAVFVTSVVFWLAGLIVARRVRWQDFILSIAVARLPNVLVGGVSFLLLPPSDVLLAEATAGVVNLRVVAVALTVILPGFAWGLIWLFMSFKTSSGLKGPRLAIAFPVTVIASEIASKACLYVLSSSL